MQKKKRSRSSTGKKSRAGKRTKSAGLSLRDALTQIQAGIDKIDREVDGIARSTTHLSTSGLSLVQAVAQILAKVQSL